MTELPIAIQKGRKFDQVVAGAREVFMADGYEGASVDRIASVAKVSKATLYSYFADKQQIFMQVAEVECQRQSREAVDNIDTTAPPRVVLGQAGRHFLRFVTSQFGLQIFRICVAEAERFPDLGRRFYNSGPAVMRKEMAEYFEEARARGELVFEDPLFAADQFGELCKAGIWMQLVFGVIDDVSVAEIDRVVDNAVETFMARYGT